MSAAATRNKRKGTLLVRAEAGARIGMGHILRCCALGEAWKAAGGEAVFLTRAGVPDLEAKLLSAGFGVQGSLNETGSEADAGVTAEVAKGKGASWIVLDGYEFSSRYQTLLRASGLPILCLDDTAHLDHYTADIVLNQNIAGHPAMYRNRESYTRLLLGTRYALLRRDFLEWRPLKRETPPVAKRLLLTMGGADPDNITLRVLRALRSLSIPGLELAVIAGPANVHRETLVRELDDYPFPHRLLFSVPHMPEIMDWADMAVSGGGSTLWELAFMGVPTLMVILADNQKANAEGMAGEGIGINLGSASDLSSAMICRALKELAEAPGRRKEMSARGRKLVDGRGAERVVRRMLAHALTIRPVRGEDCEIIWKWANEPEVRSVSFSSQPISWEDHRRWFQDRMKDPQCLFFLAMNEDREPVGDIRLERKGGETVISVVVAAPFRGLGYGSRIIEMGAAEFFKGAPRGILHAYVKNGNDPSKRAFRNAGFKPGGALATQEGLAEHFILEEKDFDAA